MRLVKTTARLSFADALRPWLDLREVLRIVSKDANAEIQGGPFIVNQEKEKTRVSVQVRALQVECQRETDPGQADGQDHIIRVVDLSAQIDSVAPLPPFRQVRFDGYFIEAYSLPFHELVELMKKKFLRPGELVDAGTDVGFSIDTTSGPSFKHVQLGPMAAQQLRQDYLAWPIHDLPEQFVFANLAQQRDEETAFGAEELSAF